MPVSINSFLLCSLICNAFVIITIVHVFGIVLWLIYISKNTCAISSIKKIWIKLLIQLCGCFIPVNVFKSFVKYPCILLLSRREQICLAWLEISRLSSNITQDLHLLKPGIEAPIVLILSCHLTPVLWSLQILICR